LTPVTGRAPRRVENLEGCEDRSVRRSARRADGRRAAAGAVWRRLVLAAGGVPPVSVSIRGSAGPGGPDAR
jgi:hypothetical protein